MNTSSLRLGAGLFGVGLALVIAVPALAHADLVASDPEDGAVLAVPPTAVTLTFSEGLDAGKSSFMLIGPDGDIGSGTAGRDGATRMVLAGLVLAPGEYRVKWTAAADDGHVERGSLGFSVSAPTPVPSTPSPSPAPSPTPATTTTPSAASTTSPPATPVPGAPAAASDTDVLIPIVAGLVLVALVGGFVLRRSRRV